MGIERGSRSAKRAGGIVGSGGRDSEDGCLIVLDDKILEATLIARRRGRDDGRLRAIEGGVIYHRHRKRSRSLAGEHGHRGRHRRSRGEARGQGVTVVSAAGAEGKVTVPLTGAEPSVALAANEMLIGFTVKFVNGSELIPLATTVTE